LIHERPAAWARWKGSDVRRKVLRQFPYSIGVAFGDGRLLKGRARAA
jgi:hypothetical protein